MRTLELREGNGKIAVEYVKVTNPENQSQFVYVQKDIYAEIVRQISRDGLGGFFGDLWNGVMTVVGGTIKTVVGGVIGGITGHVPGSGVATSPSANGQPGITVYTNPGSQVPAAILPGQNQNSILTIGAIVLGGIVLLKVLK